MAIAKELVDIFLPILLCVGVGFLVSRPGAAFDSKTLRGLVAHVGYPALVLSHLSGQHITVTAFLATMLATLVALIAFGVISVFILRLLGLPMRAFLSPMVLNNVGNIGVPVSSFAFGDEGLAYGLAVFVVVMIGLFTIAVWIPMGKVTPGDIAKQPVIYAVIVALILMATGTTLPTALDRTFSLLGGLAIPLMLLLLGHSIASLNAGNLWRGFGLAVIHIAMAAVVAIGVVSLFGFTGTVRSVFILLCMMPVSVTAYLWVEVYRPDEAPAVASFVMASTLLAIVVLPLVLVFWV